VALNSGGRFLIGSGTQIGVDGVRKGQIDLLAASEASLSSAAFGAPDSGCEREAAASAEMPLSTSLLQRCLRFQPSTRAGGAIEQNQTPSDQEEGSK